MRSLGPVAKAIVAGLVGGCAYLVGLLPAEAGLGDVTTVQWLGLVVFLGAGYGITWAIPNHQPADDLGDDLGESEPRRAMDY